VQYSEQRQYKQTLRTCLKYWLSFEDTPSCFLAIESKDPELGHIGNISVFITTEYRSADLSLMIGEKRVWGQGYGFEVWKAVCDHLLEHKNIRKITAGTTCVNVGMQKIMERAGMYEDGCRKKHFIIGGKEVDVLYAALYRDPAASEGLAKFKARA
ncbi:MAG: hypothetical protein A2X49_04090, partial [Lentisphaerae bacterium GWF2_52_8]